MAVAGGPLWPGGVVCWWPVVRARAWWPLSRASSRLCIPSVQHSCTVSIALWAADAAARIGRGHVLRGGVGGGGAGSGGCRGGVVGGGGIACLRFWARGCTMCGAVKFGQLLHARCILRARRLVGCSVLLGPLYSTWHVAWKKLWGGWRRRARGRFMVPRCWLSLCFFRLTRRLHPRVLVPSLSPPHAATVAVVGPA